MGSTATYALLRRLGGPVLTTGEAAAALRTSKSAASRTLRRLELDGLAQKIRYGLWNLAPEPFDPRLVAPELTRPYPAYISFESALAAHGAIDQIPRAIAVASLAKPRRIRTSVGVFNVHRLPPQLFGGFEERDRVALATVEKALFDYLYVACASGEPRRRLPELDLPASFSRKVVDAWIRKVRTPRLRTRVAQAVERALAHAEYEDATAAKETRP